MNKKLKWLLALIVGGVVAVVGGTWLYINVIKGDAPEKLTLESTGTTVVGTPSSPAPSTGATGDLTGAWTPTNASILGYRVKEVLFGQSTEGVGRTNTITGSLNLKGTTITDGSLSVPMDTIESDESRRDGQFRTRIMDVAKFPTGDLKITSPIELGSVPAVNSEFSQKVTADLTLRGVTKSVTFDAKAVFDGSVVKVNGSIPIKFEEWSIPNPSFAGSIETEDNGLLEFTLVFSKS
jgi:polyisoprenoid-binding protein YceI